MTSSTQSIKRGRGRPPKAQPIVDAPPENPVVKRSPGRPKKLDYGFDYCLGLARIGMSDVQIQEKLKLSKSTWFRYLADDGNREKLEAIRVSGGDCVRSAIYERAMHGDVGAARLVMEWLKESSRNGRKLGY